MEGIKMRLLKRSKSKKRMNTLGTEQFSTVGIFFDKTDRRYRQAQMIGLGVEELQAVRRLKNVIEENLEKIVTDFYSTITNVPHLVNIIEKNSTISQLRATLSRHVLEMFNGRIDESYLEKRSVIAVKHVEIGLFPKWYVAAFQNLQTSLNKIIFLLQLSPKEERECLISVNKLINFEMQVVLEEYDKHSDRLIVERQEKMKEEVKTLIGDISTDLKTQATDTTQVVNQLFNGTEHITTSLTKSEGNSNRTKKVSNDGRNQMDHLQNHHIEIEKKTNDISQTVERLATSSQEIQEVIQIVSGIAEQTNLLALNSSIEAARAGEHGKGFAVVADEVRKLASETQASVERISSLIEVTSKETNIVVNAIGEIQQLANEGLDQSGQTLKLFEEISAAIDVTINDFQQISKDMMPLVEMVQVIDSSSEALKSKAVRLDETVQKF